MNNLVRAIAYCFLALPSLLVMGAGQQFFGTEAHGLFFSVLFYAAIILVVVFVHEAGHAFAALRFGWRVTVFAVFPIAYRPKTRKWEFWVSPSGDLGGMVGIATDGKVRTRRRSIMLSAAGPLANFAFAAFAFCLSYLLPDAQGVIGLIAVSSLFVGLGNLLPWKSRNGAKSDGSKILSTLRSRKLAPP